MNIQVLVVVREIMVIHHRSTIILPITTMQEVITKSISIHQRSDNPVIGIQEVVSGKRGTPSALLKYSKGYCRFRKKSERFSTKIWIMIRCHNTMK